MALKFIISREPNGQEIFLDFPSSYLSEIFTTENSVVLFFSSQTVKGDGDVLSNKYYYGTRIVLAATDRGAILGASLARLIASALNSPEVESRFNLFELADSVSVEDIVGSSPTGGGATGSGETLNSVTTRGATTSNEITVGGITTDFVQLDVTATPTSQPGMFSWNADRSTVNLQLDADVAAKIGQDNYWYVKNQSGSDIPIRTPVRAAGTLGASGRILVSPMIADGSVDPKFLLGITAEEIEDGADGFVMNIGKLRQVNTSAFPEGTVLYCDPLVAGGLTGAEPEAPNLKLPIAFCINQSSNNGTIAIRTNPGSDLYSDHRVQVDQAGLTGGQLLRYNGSLTRWENWTPNFLTTVPTLDQVTTAGNTTTNAITVGLINSTALRAVVTIMDTTAGVNNPSYFGSYDNFLQLSVNRNPSTGVFAQTGKTATQISLEGDNGASSIRFYTATVNNTTPSERMRIFGGGNIAINTTTDAGYKLDVTGTGRFKDELRIERTSTSRGFVFSSGANDTIQWNNGTLDIQFNSSTPVSIARMANFVGGVSYLTTKLNVNAPNVISNLGYSLGVYGNLRTNGSITAVSAIGRGVLFDNTLVAAANNDVLVGLDVNPTFTNGAFTGVSNYGIRLQNSTLALFDAPIYSQAGASTSNTFFSITGAANSNYTIFSSRNLIFNTAQSMYFNTDTDGGGVTQRAWYFAGARSGTTGGRTYAAITVDNSGFPSLTIYNNDNGARILLSSNAASYFNGGNLLVGTATDAGYKLDVTGTGRFTSTLTANSFVKAGGTSSQFLKADGSIDSNTYLTSYTETDTLQSVTDRGNITTNGITVGASIVDTLTVGRGAGGIATNTVFGFQSLNSNTTGIDNVAVGYQTLFSNTTGRGIAIGSYSLYSNISGRYNIGIGENSLYSNTTGWDNIGIGRENLVSSVDGFSNVAIGNYSLLSTVSGDNNVGIGTQTLQNTLGNDNIAIGYLAGQFNNSGSNNIFIGKGSNGVSPIESNRTWIGTATTTSTWLAGNVLIGTTTDAGFKLAINGTLSAQLANAIQTNQVYYDSVTGQLTYDSLSIPTSQEVADSSKITATAPTGSTQISAISATSYTSARFEYTITDSTNYRTGTISAVWDNSTVQFAETSTSDIGDTSALTFAVSVTGGTAELVANAVTGGWTVYVVGYGI